MVGISFVEDKTASFALILIGYAVLGNEVLINSLKNIRSGSLFDENFLMVIATVGALYVGSYTEALAVLLLFQIGRVTTIPCR